MDLAKINKLKEDKEELKAIFKDKKFKNLSSSDKDRLLEQVCKMLNLID